MKKLLYIMIILIYGCQPISDEKAILVTEEDLIITETQIVENNEIEEEGFVEMDFICANDLIVFPNDDEKLIEVPVFFSSIDENTYFVFRGEFLNMQEIKPSIFENSQVKMIGFSPRGEWIAFSVNLKDGVGSFGESLIYLISSTGEEILLSYDELILDMDLPNRLLDGSIRLYPKWINPNSLLIFISIEDGSYDVPFFFDALIYNISTEEKYFLNNLPSTFQISPDLSLAFINDENDENPKIIEMVTSEVLKEIPVPPYVRQIYNQPGNLDEMKIWSPDSNYLIINQYDHTPKTEIYSFSSIISMEGEEIAPINLSYQNYRMNYLEWSPSGRLFVSLVSYDNNNDKIYDFTKMLIYDVEKMEIQLECSFDFIPINFSWTQDEKSLGIVGMSKDNETKNLYLHDLRSGDLFILDENISEFGGWGVEEWKFLVPGK